MGLALLGDMLTRPRPMGQRENRRLFLLSHGTQHSERSSCRHSPVGRASKTDA